MYIRKRPSETRFYALVENVQGKQIVNALSHFQNIKNVTVMSFELKHLRFRNLQSESLENIVLL